MSLLEDLHYYKKCLTQEHIWWLSDRGINAESIETFEIGWCPKEDDSPFRGRIIIPLFSLHGDVIGFNGRSLDGTTPKYKNSGDSDHYKKSRNLFGLDKTQDFILKEGIAIIVEGEFDSVICWQNGIRNVVSSSGTSLTKYQIRLLKRFADSCIICYDGDRAGIAAAERAVEGLSEERLPLKYVAMPPGLDPNEMIKKEGREAFISLISNA